MIVLIDSDNGRRTGVRIETSDTSEVQRAGMEAGGCLDVERNVLQDEAEAQDDSETLSCPVN